MLTCLDEKEQSREEATSLEGSLSFRSIHILQVPIHNILKLYHNNALHSFYSCTILLNYS